MLSRIVFEGIRRLVKFYSEIFSAPTEQSRFSGVVFVIGRLLVSVNKVSSGSDRQSGLNICVSIISCRITTC